MRTMIALALAASLLGGCASQPTEAERICGDWAVNTGHALQYDDCLAKLSTDAAIERDRAGDEQIGRVLGAALGGFAAGAAAAGAYSAPAPVIYPATPSPLPHFYQCNTTGVGPNSVQTICH